MVYLRKLISWLGGNINDDELCSKNEESKAEVGNPSIAQKKIRKPEGTKDEKFKKRKGSSAGITRHQRERIYERWDKEKPLIEELVREKSLELRKAFYKSIKKDEFSNIVSDGRVDVINRFLDSHKIFGESNSSTQNEELRKRARRLIKSLVNKLEDDDLKLGFDGSKLPDNGLDFEFWVAAQLKKFGWDATVTTGSADQGVDVMAIKAGVKVGIQCKLYSSNVGNKAVQEIIAAKSYFDFDHGAVITNAGYTKSAQELANKSKIKLLNQFDITEFDRIFLP